ARDERYVRPALDDGGYSPVSLSLSKRLAMRSPRPGNPRRATPYARAAPAGREEGRWAFVRRTLFNEDHEAFRETIRAFIEAEVVPVYDDWFAAGQAPRDFYYKLGELGVFGITVPEEFGGAGIESYKFEAVLYEETARAGVQFGGSGVHVLLALPYIKMLAT